MYTSLPFGAPGVRRDRDGAHIPADPRNGDWRAYQSWLAAGNKPTAAPAVARAAPIPDARTVLAALGFSPAQIETAIQRAGG